MPGLLVGGETDTRYAGCCCCCGAFGGQPLVLVLTIDCIETGRPSRARVSQTAGLAVGEEDRR
jgi:hypothetical protein